MPHIRTAVLRVVTFVVLALAAPAVLAEPISFNALNPSQTGAPNSTVIFQGTVTNMTGVSLNATDLGLNFYGFDPVAIMSVDQLLGTPDFVLTDGTTSAIVNLFSVTLGPGAVIGQAYTIDAVLQDINNNTSGVVRVGVTAGADPIPEPATLLLLGTGLAGAAAYRKRYNNFCR